jgi:hypothetical protein
MGFKFRVPDLPRIAFLLVCVCSVIGLAFTFGLYSGAKRNSAFAFAKSLKESVSLVVEEAPTLSGVEPTHFLQPARYDGSGVTVNKLMMDNGDLILLAGFFEDSNELRLIRRNGALVARWPVRFSEIFPDASHMFAPPATDWNIDIAGGLALPDGSVVFTFEGGGLVKLDRCGDIVWRLLRETHHSVERAEDGAFWVPGRRHYSDGDQSPFPPFEPPFSEDTILKVSEDGVVLSEISAPQLFYENGLEAVLTASGHSFDHGMHWDHEIIHLNKIDVLESDIAHDFPLFEQGDLAVSIRESNLLMVVDPDSRRIKWWQIGPWLRQHDPEFMKGGTIAVFNNNTYYSNRDRSQAQPFSAPRTSNVLAVDPLSGELGMIYGHQTGQAFLSVLRGHINITPDDGLLITEPEGGRVFQIDADANVVWEYVNRYDTDTVAEVNAARMYPPTYFIVEDWSCAPSEG